MIIMVDVVFSAKEERKVMLERYLLLLLLFLGAVITVHLVSWVGSVLHSVPNGADSSYAVFTFRADQNKSMSTNILMNILIPNVCFIFIYMTLFNLNIKCRYSDLIFYVIFYYVYRVLLICLILKRKELLNVWYELFNGTVGILIAYFLAYYFLIKPEDVFIDVKELVNEFWLLVILIVYRFIVLLMDKIFCQRNVVSQNMLDKYIKNKFNYFYNKYKTVIHITNEDKNAWIILFSLMIFENYNRGGIKRKIERLKILGGRSATVGIMQIKTNENLSDEDSIILAYDKLRNEIMAEDIAQGIDADDEMQIEDYAYQYNPDEDYAKSISFIYQHLRAYLKRHPKYREVFYLKDESAAHDVVQAMPLQFNDEEHELLKTCEAETKQVKDCNDAGYWTFGDVVQMSGLTRKQVKKRIKSKNMSVLLLESEVQENFKKYLPKG